MNRKYEQEGSSDNVSKASFPASKYPSAKGGGGAKEAWNFRDGPDIAELQTARLVHVNARGSREADQRPIRTQEKHRTALVARGAEHVRSPFCIENLIEQGASAAASAAISASETIGIASCAEGAGKGGARADRRWPWRWRGEERSNQHGVRCHVRRDREKVLCGMLIAGRGDGVGRNRAMQATMSTRAVLAPPSGGV